MIGIGLCLVLIVGLLAFVFVLRTATVDYPILGTWHEDMRLNCDTNEWFVPVDSETLIGEVRLRNDGIFDVTWHPFETYVDYAGDFSYDDKLDTLILQARSVNYLPNDFDGDGTASIDDSGRLVLEGIYLGTSRFGGDGQLACGHVFSPR